jgi:phospholipid/cholesterol/gamma-HCH transport system permease protein
MRHIFADIRSGGIDALPVVILMAATIGVMLSIQRIHSLRIFGAESQVTFGLALSVPREFAPLISGIIVAGRSGSQLTSRVGSMRLNGELDAPLKGVNGLQDALSQVVLDMSDKLACHVSSSKISKSSKC